MLDGVQYQRVARQVATGAVLGVLCAVAAYMLGVQQLTRKPEISFFLPAALVGAVVGTTRLRRLLWIGGGLLAALCILVAYTPLVRAAAHPLVRSDPLQQPIDAIAALSAGVSADGLARSESLDRFLSAIELEQKGVAPTLMVSREHARLGTGTVTDSADLASIAALTSSAPAIVFVDSILTTRTEALQMKKIADARGWRRIAVVTSPMHSRRACATFEAVGFQVVCVPAAMRGSGMDPHSTPEDRFRGFRSWLYETFATDSYRRRGWIR